MPVRTKTQSSKPRARTTKKATAAKAVRATTTGRGRVAGSPARTAKSKKTIRVGAGIKRATDTMSEEKQVGIPSAPKKEVPVAKAKKATKKASAKNSAPRKAAARKGGSSAKKTVRAASPTPRKAASPRKAAPSQRAATGGARKTAKKPASSGRPAAARASR